MRKIVAVVMLGIGLMTGLELVGCGGKGDAPAGGKAGAPPAASATAAVTAPATTMAGARPPTLPAGRSPAPTLAEWARMKEITVKGSSALKCETKILREYLRIACRGKVDPEGTPKGIKIIKGGRGEALIYEGADMISLIVPYLEGTDLEAVFSWSAKSHKLVAKWPRGTRQPVIVGTFEGAASPLDGTAKGDSARLCECHKKVNHATSCDDIIGSADADCDRSYGSNCQALLECSRGEPGRFPSCLPGFENAGAMGRCYRECGPGKAACAKGFTCSTDMGPSLCVED
jgi:hypothetical protein